ncbi:MAG TPA: DUF4405 domain-containing protein [Anaerohalosphaeraceae bacterium]|nr:DUF4405 domain-containing protein [Anaerohalosphaeraceae bacterium]
MTAICFAMAVISGAVLFLAPSGRGAGRAWAFWGLSRRQWEEQHVWFCLIFTIVGLIHLILNIRPILYYLKIVGIKTYWFRLEWLAALAVSAVVFAGTYYRWKPFAAFLELPRRMTEPGRQAGGTDMVARGGGQENRPGIGQMTLAEYCRQEGLEPAKAVEILRNRGLTVQTDMTMRQIADLAGVHPSQLRDMLRNP